MDEERIPTALARIEAAIGRIDAQTARPSARSPTAPVSTGANLVARHEGLREAVEASLAELDGLIERLDR